MGVRQRVHEVEQRAEGIFVRLDAGIGRNAVESDKYAAHSLQEVGGLLSPDSSRSAAGPPAAPGAPKQPGAPRPPAALGAGGGALPGTTGARGFAGKPSGQIFQQMREDRDRAAGGR